jgi:hypothetical protein
MTARTLRKTASPALLAASVLWFAGSVLPAGAEPRLTIPCGAGPPCGTTVSAHIDAVFLGVVGMRLPWTASVAVPANLCFVVATGMSDAAVIKSVVAPNGLVYRNRGTGALVIRRTPIAGWYSVVLDSPPPAREQIFSVGFTLFNSSQCATTTIGR